MTKYAKKVERNFAPTNNNAERKIPAELDSAIPYYLNSSLILLSMYLCYTAHLPLLYIFIVYGVLPVLDDLFAHDWANPTLEEFMELENQWRFKLPLYINIVVEWFAYFYCIRELLKHPLYTQPVYIFILMGLSTTGFLISHELFHKNGWLNKAIGTLHQIKYLYMHFTVEHVQGHHKRVSTPEDPASAPKGMTLGEFVPRSIIGSFKSALQINPRFVMLTIVGDLIFLGIIWAIFGARGVFLAILLALGSINMLETINYVYHYGLQRKQLPDGTYEKVTIKHSWNAPHKLSNFLLLKIQRHSDHHENALKPYHVLNSYLDAPQLPHGYIVSLYACTMPKLWFDMMDPLVDEYQRAGSAKFKPIESPEYAKAQAKTKVFVKGAFLVTFALAIAQILWRVVL